MMAQYLEGVTEMPAGNLVALGGLDDFVFKTATLSTTHLCPSLTPVSFKVNIIFIISINPF